MHVVRRKIMEENRYAMMILIDPHLERRRRKQPGIKKSGIYELFLAIQYMAEDERLDQLGLEYQTQIVTPEQKPAKGKRKPDMDQHYPSNDG